MFTGTAGERVSLVLAPVDSPSLLGRATLLLVDTTSGHGALVGSDRTSLPNHLTEDLPANGEYHVGVQEASKLALLSGQKFSGEYCLTLDSNQGAAQSLQPTSSVEGLGSTISVTESTSQPRSGSRSSRTRSGEASSGRSRSR